MFGIKKTSTSVSRDECGVEYGCLVGDSGKISEGGYLKKVPRGVSGRVARFGFKPARLNILGSTLANGIIKNMSK